MDTTKHTLLISTTKGLITYKRKNHQWVFDREDFLGLRVSFTYVDPRDNSWWVSLSLKHWGEKLYRSYDQGKHWEAVKGPKFPEGTEVSPGKPASVKLIWSMSHAGMEEKGSYFLGTEPGGLFKSDQIEEGFKLDKVLWDHPSRIKHWFGGGRNHAGIHSIIVDPQDSQHIYIGISCAGVFESLNGGEEWHPLNKGLRADYLPDPYVEVGHDPHLLLACASQPQIMWQQNHCGVFRSENGGKQWVDVTDDEELTRYGFALAIDDEDPLKAWVIPAVSDEQRVAINRALCVCRTIDGGKNWEILRTGLPQQHVYDIVYRHAFAKNRNSLAFGTTTGNIFVSENEGDSWYHLSHFLPMVNAVCFA